MTVILFPTRRGMVPAVRGLLDALVSGYETFGQKRLDAKE